MAPKKVKSGRKKSPEHDEDPVYAAKRARNNEAVRKSRDKSKKQAEETMKKVQKLRDENKTLEGKIDEQKKTKKFLKDLFLQQTTTKMEKPTQEQWDMINEEDSESDENRSESDSMSSEDAGDDSRNPASPSSYSTSSSRR